MNKLLETLKSYFGLATFWLHTSEDLQFKIITTIDAKKGVSYEVIHLGYIHTFPSNTTFTSYEEALEYINGMVSIWIPYLKEELAADMVK